MHAREVATRALLPTSWHALRRGPNASGGEKGEGERTACKHTYMPAVRALHMRPHLHAQCPCVRSMEDLIELTVPPDLGNGRYNSGVALASLLWSLPAEGIASVVASILLERRIVFVSQSRSTVSAAVQAAHALVYPFR